DARRIRAGSTTAECVRARRARRGSTRSAAAGIRTSPASAPPVPPAPPPSESPRAPPHPGQSPIPGPLIARPRSQPYLQPPVSDPLARRLVRDVPLYDPPHLRQDPHEIRPRYRVLRAAVLDPLDDLRHLADQPRRRLYVEDLR